jgi:hypothetical protein
VAELHVIYRSIDTLTPYRGNARTHNRSQIRKLRDSIQAFGFVNPVLINTSGTIVAGHGRVQAAKLLGMTEVPTISLENLTPDQIRAYVIADNRLAEDAGWDEQILKIELQHLISLPDIDVSITGFEVTEIDLIIGPAPVEEDPDDQLPEETDEVITKPGDLWCLGHHRIYCGDARSASSFTTLMGDRQAAVVFLDPPYNVAIEGHASGNGRIHHAEFAMASGEMSEAEFTEFLATSLKTSSAIARFTVRTRMSSPVDRLHEEFQSLVAHLGVELSLLSTVDDGFRKLLLVSSASFFEFKLTEYVAAFAAEASNSSSLISEIIRRKAISRQYHTWFDWDANNAKAFYKLFGKDFEDFMRATHISEPWLTDSVRAFMELGRERNKMVHGNFGSFFLEKTASEVFVAYTVADRFVEAVPNLLRECNRLQSISNASTIVTSSSRMATTLQQLRVQTYCKWVNVLIRGGK